MYTRTISDGADPTAHMSERPAPDRLAGARGEDSSVEIIPLKSRFKQFFAVLWVVVITTFALVHLLHLSADFPNHTAWHMDWAKYTDEGWYGNAAVRARLFGHWYLPGDFNPAPAVPVWPALEWVLFGWTGVSIVAARALTVSFFILNLGLTYLLLRTRARRWVCLLAITLSVTSPFLYAFSRLAILEPLLTALTLLALNLAVRMPKSRRPLLAAGTIGVLFTLMMLTKTTAVFLTPMLGWALLAGLWQRERKKAVQTALTAIATFLATFGLWMGLVIHAGLYGDYKYLFFINKYVKPVEWYWPAWSFWWSFHGGLWVDHILIPLAGVLTLVIAARALIWKDGWARKALLDPVFGAALLATAGYILFMTYQNHPQPRYYAFVAVFCFMLVALGADALLRQTGRLRQAGQLALAVACVAIGINIFQMMNFAMHPEYTLVTAAKRLTRYIDTHPNGNRQLVSISGDDVTMMTGLPTLCDDFGTEELVSKLNQYQPGWWATWNDIDPGTLEDLHNLYSLEQVASFRAMDDPERNVLVLFKLHRLPGGEVRSPADGNLQKVLPGDRILIPIE